MPNSIAIAAAGGERFFAAKEDAPDGTFTALRQVGGETLYAASLSPEDDHAHISSWSASWDHANAGHPGRTDRPSWRCGGMVFALSGSDLDGEEL